MNGIEYLVEAFRTIDRLLKTIPDDVNPEPVCYGYVMTINDILYSLQDQFSMYTVSGYCNSTLKMGKLMSVDSINKISRMCDKYCNENSLCHYILSDSCFNNKYKPFIVFQKEIIDLMLEKHFDDIKDDYSN
jgi:hypothetical protein